MARQGEFASCRNVLITQISLWNCILYVTDNINQLWQYGGRWWRNTIWWWGTFMMRHPLVTPFGDAAANGDMAAIGDTMAVWDFDQLQAPIYGSGLNSSKIPAILVNRPKVRQDWYWMRQPLPTRNVQKVSVAPPAIYLYIIIQARQGELRRGETVSLLAWLTKAKHLASLIYECGQPRLASPRGHLCLKPYYKRLSFASLAVFKASS